MGTLDKTLNAVATRANALQETMVDSPVAPAEKPAPAGALVDAAVQQPAAPSAGLGASPDEVKRAQDAADRNRLEFARKQYRDRLNAGDTAMPMLKGDEDEWGQRIHNEVHVPEWGAWNRANKIAGR